MSKKHVSFKRHWPLVVVCDLLHKYRVDRRARIVGDTIHYSYYVGGGKRKKKVMQFAKVVRTFRELYGEGLI